MFELNRLTLHDAETLSRLSSDTFEQAYADLYSRENIRRYCAENYSPGSCREALSEPATECVMASAEGNPAGFHVIRHYDCPYTSIGGSSSELKQIYILPDYYGKGLGKLLFDDVLMRIRAKGRERIWLCVADKNHRAQAFYRKLKLEAVAEGPLLEVGTEHTPSTILTARI